MSGPFTDADARHLLAAIKAGQKINETQNAIIPYIEEMARVLAEAARASAEAGRSLPMAGRQIGTEPLYALDRWLEVIRKEAVRIIEESVCEPPNPTRKKTSTSISRSAASTSASPLLEGMVNPGTPTESGARKAVSSPSK